jgi:hypothetical protein
VPLRLNWLLKSKSKKSPGIYQIQTKLFKALDYAIRGFQLNQDGLKLNGTHQHLIYVDDVSILGGSVHTIKKNR